MQRKQIVASEESSGAVAPASQAGTRDVAGSVSDQPFERVLDSRLILSIVATGLMSFCGVLIETAMNVTFPTLMDEFGVGTSTVQWITTGYLLVLAVTIPTSSFLKRRFPMRGLFATAALLFLVGTLAAAMAPAFGVVLAGRLIQGLGTGIALPLMFNIVLEQAPYSHMGVMMGVGALITAVAPAIGPTMGGLLVGTVGWRYVFWVLVPLIVAALVCGVYAIRQVTPPERCSLDVWGLVLLAGGFACFVFGASLASTEGWTSPLVLGLFLATVLLLGAFGRRSLRHASPLLRVSVFAYPIFTLSVAIILLIQLICLGLSFLIPNEAQLSFGLEALPAGLLLMPGCVLSAALAPLSGRILDRLGAARPIVTGTVSVLIGTGLLAAFSQSLMPLMAAGFYLFFSFGQGNIMGNVMTNGLDHLPDEVRSDGNAIINTVQQLAGALGTSVVSTFVAAGQAAHPLDLALGTRVGCGSAYMFCAVLAVLMVLCALLIFGVKRNRN